MMPIVTYEQALAELISFVGESVSVMLTATSGSPVAHLDGVLISGEDHGFAHASLSSEHLRFRVASVGGTESCFYIVERDFRAGRWERTPAPTLSLLFGEVEFAIASD